MIDVLFELSRANGTVLAHSCKVPALPRVGDHVSNDKKDFSGRVHSITFWWNEKGKLQIVANLK